MDTDHLGVLQHRTSPECTRLMLRMQACSDTDVFVSIISFHEQVLGWNAYLARAKEAVSVARAYQRFQQILSDFSESQVLPFGVCEAELFDEMRAQRVRIGTMDLRIACIALTHGFTLLTRNRRDFEKVPGLCVEDWTS